MSSSSIASIWNQNITHVVISMYSSNSITSSAFLVYARTGRTVARLHAYRSELPPGLATSPLLGLRPGEASLRNDYGLLQVAHSTILTCRRIRFSGHSTTDAMYCGKSCVASCNGVLVRSTPIRMYMTMNPPTLNIALEKPLIMSAPEDVDSSAEGDRYAE